MDVKGSSDGSLFSYEFHTSPEHYQTSKDKLTIRSIWEGLKTDTTAHGIPHVNTAKGPVKKIFWVVMFLTAFGFLLYLTSSLVYQYFSYNVDIVMYVQHEKELLFPAVTICNMNPIKKSQAYRDARVEQLVNDVSYNLTFNQGQPVPGSRFPDRILSRESIHREEELAEIMTKISTEEKMSMGYQGCEMILSCQYSGNPCSCHDFDHFYNAMHGNCYIFNSGWKEKEIHLSKKTGRRYGLQLVLDIQQHEYLADIVEAAGVRVTIHPHSSMPFPQDHGMVVSPGLLTSIGVKQLTTERLGNEYGECVNSVTRNNSINVFAEHYPVGYSVLGCYKTCYQRHLVERCGCGDPQYPLVGAAFHPIGSTEPCYTSNITQDDCKYETSRKLNQGYLECPECVLPCLESYYNSDISTMLWPSEQNKEWIMKNLLRNRQNPSKSLKNFKDFKNSVLKLEVFYEEFNYEYVKEIPAYTGGQFASDVGGLLGLWLGISLISIVEVFEFLTDALVLYCHKLKLKMATGNKISPKVKRQEKRPTLKHRESTCTSANVSPVMTMANVD